MNPRQLKKQLLFSFLMVNFLLVAILFTVFAWFTLQDQTMVGNFSVSIQSPHVIEANVETYAIGDYSQDVFGKTFYLALENNELVHLDYLPTYDDRDIIFTEFKPYLALNLRFKLASNNADCRILATTVHDFQTTANNWISNCTRFLVAAYTEDTKTLFVNSNPLSFVSVNENDISKEGTIELLRDNFTSRDVSLWFILEYHKSAIDYIHDIFFGSIVEMITYENDIRLEIDD